MDNLSLLGSVSFGWLREKGCAGYEEAFFMDPERRLAQEARANALVAETFPDQPIYNFEAHLVQAEGRRRPVALVGGLQPNLILGAAVGAKFVFYGDKDPDITQTPLMDIQNLDPLWKIDWENVWPISLFLDQIGRMRETHGDRYAIVPPFFWDTSGRATFHGIVTTALKLMGERIFVEMAINPSFVREFFEWIAEAYSRMSRVLARAAGLEVTGVHIGDCSACMIGPDQYAEFILPALNKLAGQLGALRLHSCGQSDHLLEVFGELGQLGCLNVGSGTSITRIRERFGKLRIDLIPEMPMLTYGTPGDVDGWIRRTVEENGAGRLEFQFHLDLGQPEANCLQFAKTLRELGIPVCREQVY